MKKRDQILLEQAYQKVLIREGNGKYVEVGFGTGSLPDPITLDMSGQKYIVSGELDVDVDVTYEDPEYQNIQGYGRVQTYGGGSYAEGDPDIKILNMAIQIPEMVKTKNSSGVEIEEEKFVYEFYNKKLTINELGDKPEVIQAAKDALINKVAEYYNQNPEKFDPDY